MKVTKDLTALLTRIRLDHEEIIERFRFLNWSAEDAERLGAAAQQMAPAQQAFVDHLYRHLEQFSTPSALLRAPQVTARLKHSQAEYYQRLWGGPYDDAYVNGRLRIGVIHQQVGLELKWYLGSYRLYLDDMLASVFDNSDQAKLYSSLLKAVFFDMTLAIDTYSAAQHKALEDSEARFARALRGASDGIWDWHVDQDRLYVSERWASMLGLSRDSIGESSASWFGRVHPDDLPDFRQAIDAHLQGQTSFVHHEYRIRQNHGSYLWVLVRGVAEATTPGQLRMAGSQSDISARKDAEQRLKHAARHDPLTGLANRMRLDEQMQKTFMKLRKGGAHEALLFIDLDRFKLINDSLGHNVGDRVLVEVAQRLRDSLRPGDQLFRFGGDEFIVLLHELTCDRDAERVSQRILDNLHQPLHMDGRTLVVSASIGIAPLHDNGKALDVLQAADLALYRAKSAGKARFAHYSEALQGTAQHHLELESALGQALQRNEFELHYQPIYRLDQGAPILSGVEALLRWRHGERLISPLEFIPALEESGEIIRVGEWVLREACQQTRFWQLAGHDHLRCSVNISSLQLQQADFTLRLIEILQESGLPPASLILEITESQLMHDDMDTLACLNELTRFGVLLALDDFGTGYSSLGYLTRFPLHILKLDRSFIDGIPSDKKQSAISQAIIGLGRSLGLEVVAEGIESPAQLDFVVSEGCHYAQGYWFSRPRPAAQMQRLFSAEDCFEGVGGPLL
ncbi:diguanylate cyclase [Pseudomonas fluorescens HK44]|uniref:Diguanylate cyclase DosC n=1 Tax=Pseudomonas fluorescens HK44 TaxID=1042209 RepID=A0A010SM04_PSEFL|nr:EAL domain-containing protein [Pseudomonas fluorescens]EXF93990.1 diguanylate cyclase [Pseudomonas fluorescens HK44]